MGLIAKGRDVLPGSDAAIEIAQRALFHGWRMIAPLLGSPTELGEDSGARRAAIIADLRLLEVAQVLPRTTGYLRLALEEVERGFTVPEAKADGRRRQGGTANSRRLRLMRDAFEAMARLRRTNPKPYKVFAYDFRKRFGVALVTVEGYEAKLTRAPTDYRVRPAWVWGLTRGSSCDPAAVLDDALRGLRAG